MSIEFFCSNGHKIRAKQSFAGKPGKCPRCNTKVVVPTESSIGASRLAARNALTESGVQRILGDARILDDNPPSTSENYPQSKTRQCPKCRQVLKGSATICSNCQLYVGLHSADDITIRQSVWNSNASL